MTQPPPARLRRHSLAHGKPALVDAPDCHFNLSHSEDVALVGIGQTCEIGVDIEMLRPIDLGADVVAAVAWITEPARR